MFSRKALFRLIVPLMVEQTLAVTIGMADTVMVAGVGEAAVSGVALVDTINILLINIFVALATGGAIVVAQCIGRDAHKDARDAAKQLLLVTTAASILIMAVCLAFTTPILHLLFGNVEESVMANARIYFFLSAFAYPMIAIYNVGAALFRAMGNSRVSMAVSLLMNIVNVSGNALLIFGFHLGVVGAAIASLVSRFLAAVIILWLITRPTSQVYVEEIWKPTFRPKTIQRILAIGIPNGLESGMFQVGKIMVQGLIASFGTAAIAANAVANSIASVAIIPGSAIGLALITVVGQCVGAGNFTAARRYMLRLTGVAYAAMLVMNVFVLFASGFIVSAFGLHEDTAAIARELLIWNSVFCIVFHPAAFTLPNGLRAASDVRFTMSVSIFTMWVFRIGFSYILGQYFHMGVLGVWIAMFIDWVVRGAFFTVRLLSNKWQRNKSLASGAKG